MSGAVAVYAVVGASLVAYVLTGGADFGAGVWDLLASGPRAQRQRLAIERAIAPIWEANHIWMILVVVLSFSAFPIAFAVIATALHIPIAIALIGIVLRGAAFVLRSYGMQSPAAARRWGTVFAWSSVLTPIALGSIVAALGSDAIEIVDGRVVSGWFAGWTTVYAVSVGALALVSFALLAAVYLTVDTEGEWALQDDFRTRALACELIGGGVAVATALAARQWAPRQFTLLTSSPWSEAIALATFAAAMWTTLALLRRRFRAARVAVVTQIALVVIGWGLAMDGEIVVGAVSLRDAGARAELMNPLLYVLAGGSLVLGPALWGLLRVFKRDRALEKTTSA